MEITELPPQVNEKQLTARVVSETLGDQYLAFLAANNLKGYAEDPDYVLRTDRVSDILMLIAMSPGMTRKAMTDQSFKIVRLTNKTIRNRSALELIARALGYKSFELLRLCIKPDGFVQNVWRQPSATAQAMAASTVIEPQAFGNKINNAHAIGVLYGKYSNVNRQKSIELKAHRAKVKELKKAERAKKTHDYYEARNAELDSSSNG